MIAEHDLVPIVVLGLIIAFGALVQSVVGFGLAVVAVPFMVLIAPDLLPGAMLVTSLALPAWELISGPRDVDWQHWWWAIGGRVALMPVGVWLVAHASSSAIALIVGVLVLAGVAGSLWAVDLRPTPGGALAAGAITGISGTAASIGGPFLGLVLQHERASRIRSTLAMFFVVGAATALLGLAVGGQLRHDQIVVGLAWVPFVVAGSALAVPLRRRMPEAAMRRAVLVLAATAGAVVIVRAIVS
ncbi:sulfite exporter TauE/SafE family protein [Calidifontibacter sp. DB0510]|uniref:Probable membrane transporter protein n=1 Tax=Metallococcus carri TaxID=1656884 RepID=A0A967B089_9MICO|nr:sulfite exporter TauE/SafE family protein [Metallococcus carri]NHN54865.1 sulfite exporter TauE/SafE family protein [Metallococcus carri]NOP37210.1 sulfite exporter TauE/SafE family protein [Calidifontibacter sp. DB2511S]